MLSEENYVPPNANQACKHAKPITNQLIIVAQSFPQFYRRGPLKMHPVRAYGRAAP